MLPTSGPHHPVIIMVDQYYQRARRREFSDLLLPEEEKTERAVAVAVDQTHHRPQAPKDMEDDINNTP